MSGIGPNKDSSSERVIKEASVKDDVMWGETLGDLGQTGGRCHGYMRMLESRPETTRNLGNDTFVSSVFTGFGGLGK